MKRKFLFSFLFIGIICISAFFRLVNPNWDSGFHLHPDERFLTMVGNASRIPLSFQDYLNPSVSTFNPRNVGFSFFVYGSAPLILNKLIAVGLGNDSYGLFTIQGRVLSALFDLLTLCCVFGIAQRVAVWTKRPPWVPLIATALYGISVIPIQLSHFFAVDTFLNFFMWTSVLMAVRFLERKKIIYVVLAGVCIGLGIASKITAVMIIPLVGVIIASSFAWKKKAIVSLFLFFVFMLILGICSYTTLRIADPSQFASASFFDPRPHPVFIQGLMQLRSFEGKDIWFPPAVQWMSKVPLLSSAVNLSVVGVGIPYMMLVIIGIFIFLKTSGKYRLVQFFLVFWVIGFFLYQGSRFAHALRYFLLLVPAFAIFGSFGAHALILKLLDIRLVLVRYGVLIIFLVLLLVWPCAFINIYTRTHSRVTASEWIYENIPNQSFILSEHWDDPLPLPVLKTYGKEFKGEQLPVFDMDTDEKWNTMNSVLSKADYYILSSNRAWGSIPYIPWKYPRMSVFYQELFAGKQGYKKIAEFTQYPRLDLGFTIIEFSDDLADESFTVYDHPKVMIFERVR